MKILLTTILLAVSLFGAHSEWLHDYDAGLKAAAAEHKAVYLMIGADRCRFCRKFKETTLSDEGVMRKLRASFVLVYLSRDRHAIPDQFERFGAPRHYFLDQNGTILDQDAGYLDPAAFSVLIDDVTMYR